MNYQIAVDVGGTYTDCVAVDEAGVKTARKAPTVPKDRAVGVIDSLCTVAKELQFDSLFPLLAQTKRFVHGSTVATNVMVERSGARTALLTTRGHEDAIYIGRGRQRVAGLSESQITHVTHHKKPVPLVPRTRALGLVERIDSNGDILVALDKFEVERVLSRMVDDGVEALAVCFLWSITNRTHELLVREVVDQSFPSALYVSLSSEVSPVLGEYERLTSTVINAYIGPAVASYTRRLESALQGAGLKVPVLFTQANGGLATSGYVQERPIVMLDSGPAAGVLGVSAFSPSIAQANILCADVGGTTFDVGIVIASRPEEDEFPVIDQFEFRMPKILVKSIGAGGGSVAWLDSRKMLRVGPQSAGALPGPACYQRGGTSATVTDAYLILGYLDPAVPLASGVRLDGEAAYVAIGRLAEELGWSVDQTAAAVIRISENQMGDLLHRVTLERGLDPRDFALSVYGGAGPLYAAAISQAIGITAVYIMPEAGSFSALAMLSTDLVWSTTIPIIERFPLSESALNRMSTEAKSLAGAVAEFFSGQGIGREGLELRTSYGMRFGLQAYHLNIPIDDLDPTNSDALRTSFLMQYRALYGNNSVFAPAPIETVNVTVTGFSRVNDDTLFARPSPTGLQTRPVGRRQVFFHGHGWVDAAVYHFEILDADDVVEGPAVVHRSGDTISVPPEWYLTLGTKGELALRHFKTEA